MILTIGLRKLAMTLHVIASVGWVGAVAVFLTLAVIGLVSPDIGHARASYDAMDLAYGSVVIPLGLASLVTGIISSLGTEWGLFRYYWVVVKLVLTVPAVALMLAHAQLVGYMARAAAATAFSITALSGLRIQLLAYACGALLVLAVATALSIYKPRGKTPYWARAPYQRSKID
jgi:hypothetical protein